MFLTTSSFFAHDLCLCSYILIQVKKRFLPPIDPIAPYRQGQGRTSSLGFRPPAASTRVPAKPMWLNNKGTTRPVTSGICDLKAVAPQSPSSVSTVFAPNSIFSLLSPPAGFRHAFCGVHPASPGLASSRLPRSWWLAPPYPAHARFRIPHRHAG